MVTFVVLPTMFVVQVWLTSCGKLRHLLVKIRPL